MTKIVIVSREYSPSLRCGGIGSFFSDLSSELCNQRLYVTILCASDNTKSETIEHYDGKTVHRLSGADFCVSGVEGSEPLSSFRSWLRQTTRYNLYRQCVANELDKLIEEDNCDVVISSEYGAETIIWASKKRNVPLIVHCDGPTYLDRASGQRARFFLRQFPLKRLAAEEYRMLKHADAICTPSLAMADFISHDCGLHGDIKVIPNFVRFDKWYTKISEPVNGRIFFAGTITEGKGAFDLIDAVKKLRSKGYDLTLRMAGRIARAGKKFQSYFERDNGIELLGMLPRDCLKKEYAEAELVCFPSWWEPFGIVCIEAMASGTLVLMSNKGAGPEIIKDGVNGFLIEPKDSSKLANKIAEILNLPFEKKNLIRLRAQEDIRNNFDSSIIIPKFIDYIKNVIQNYHGRAEK